MSIASIPDDGADSLESSGNTEITKEEYCVPPPRKAPELTRERMAIIVGCQGEYHAIPPVLDSLFKYPQ